VSQKLADFAVPHLPEMAFVMKKEVVFDSMQVSLFSLDAGMRDTNQVAKLGEQF
jgi:hypothetical protein